MRAFQSMNILCKSSQKFICDSYFLMFI
jgi:hypothetical protein